MPMIFTIARLEFLFLFRTGKIWKLLALSQSILGFIFYWLMEDFLFKSQKLLLEYNSPFGITEEVIHPLFAWSALFFFFITPLLATQSISQERKNHTLELYLTSSLSANEIILGKYIGTFLIQIFLLLPIVIMPLTITLHNNLDLGQFFSGLIGLVLLLSANLSIGFLIASFTKEPLIGTLVTLIFLFFLTLLEWAGKYLAPELHWISSLALLHFCKEFLSGLINSQGISYYFSLMSIFLYFSIKRFDREIIYRTKR